MGDLVARVAGNAIGVLVYIIGCKVVNWIKVKRRAKRAPLSATAKPRSERL